MSEARLPFPGTYRDAHGTEAIEFLSDGRSLRVVIRGVTFDGTDFDLLEPVDGADAATRARFTLNQGMLCDCELRCHIPVKLSGPEGESSVPLEARLVLGGPASNGGIDREELQLQLDAGGREYRSRGASGWFEDELLDLLKQLPETIHLRMCFTCAFSDYSPYGHGLFGGLACFRDNKEGYLPVKSKAGLFRIWNTLTEFVQETYLCPEYQRRTPDSGYRG